MVFGTKVLLMQKINIEIDRNEIKRLKLSIDTISWYSKFIEGQDGFAAMEILKQFVEKLEKKING